MKTFLTAAITILLFSCQSSAQTSGKWRGTVTNGYKGDSIHFVVSPDGKQITELTFKGYWRCSGTLEQTEVGPEQSIPIVNGKADGVIVDPPDGGSTAWRFEFHGTFKENQASGTFRMNISALACDTYQLQWTAVRK